MTNVRFWISLVPALGIAGSGVVYVINLWRDSAERKRRHFFELMEFIDGPGTIATKVAAIYQLRNFPEHKDFIIRFCETQRDNVLAANSKVGAVAVESLIAEFDATRDFLKAGN
jgi:hypothetical protein